jgi:hypothetical protein
MPRLRTLAQLRSDVADRADLVDGGSGGRFPSAKLNRYINQAIQRYQQIVTGAGGQDWYEKRTGASAISASQTKDAAGWAPNQYVPLPEDFFSLIGINITIGNTTLPLQQFEQAERTMFKDFPSWLTANGNGQPVFFRINGSNASGAHIAELIPWSDGGGYTYEILYIPVVPDLVADSDTFNGIAGYEEYVIYRAACDALLNAGNTNTPLYQSVKAELTEMEREMKFKFATMAGAGRRLDTEAMRARMMRYTRGDWRVL